MSPYSQEERYLRQLLDHVSDAVVATDTLGRVTFANPAAQKLYGIAEKDAVGRGLLELLDLFEHVARTERGSGRGCQHERCDHLADLHLRLTVLKITGAES